MNFSYLMPEIKEPFGWQNIMLALGGRRLVEHHCTTNIDNAKRTFVSWRTLGTKIFLNEHHSKYYPKRSVT